MSDRLTFFCLLFVFAIVSYEAGKEVERKITVQCKEVDRFFDDDGYTVDLINNSTTKILNEKVERIVIRNIGYGIVAVGGKGVTINTDPETDGFIISPKGSVIFNNIGGSGVYVVSDKPTFIKYKTRKRGEK